MLVSSVVSFESFIPFWAFLFSTFFSLRITQLIDATYVKQLNLTELPDKTEHVAEKIDIVALKTAEISRREKKRNSRGGNIYVPITKLWLFCFFGIVFEFQEGGSFPLLPLVGMPKIHNL